MRVVFETPAGERLEVDARAGLSLMEVAVNAGVPGIDGECGGGCSCATCHVYIQPEWVDRVEPAEDYERDLLECLDDVRSNSRLSCQLRLAQQLDGLKVEIPASQGIA